jgi:O-antigen/teichoic acid export membrane protein
MDVKGQSLSKIAIKNSVYALSFASINKLGGLILTVILARLLLPELFGLYSLALSVVVITLILSDFGVDLTSIRYMSKALKKNDKKRARSVFRFLLKVKGLIVLVLILILLLISKPLSQTIFNKPLLFLPLVFSCFYILAESIKGFFGTPFTAKKDIRALVPLELVFQTSKIILSFIAISILSYELKLPGVFIALAISALIFLILEIIILIKKDKEVILGKIIKPDKKRILKYMWFTGIAGITLIFFGSIDTLMLGKFVDAEYLGYYRAALGLVVSISAILPFSGTLLPIFTQIHNKRLNRGFKKSLEYLVILIIPMAIGIAFLSKYIILLIYGEKYLIASSSLLLLSLLIIISPLISLFSTVFQAKEKPKTLAKFMAFSLILNIILNYILIKSFLSFGQEIAVLGAGTATIISNGFFLGVLTRKAKSQFKLDLGKKIILKALFATFIMAIFLFIFNRLTDLNLFLGFLEILLGILIYFSVLFLIKGITKEDLNLLKRVFRKKKIN